MTTPVPAPPKPPGTAILRVRAGESGLLQELPLELGQYVVPRPPRTILRNGVLQRGHGIPPRPYAIRKVAFRPDSPLTIR